MEGVLKVGIDVGSTTIKLIALDEKNHILAEHYARHFSEIPAALHDNLQRLHDVVGSRPFTFALTGSAGMGIAQRLHLPFVKPKSEIHPLVVLFGQFVVKQPHSH